MGNRAARLSVASALGLTVVLAVAACSAAPAGTGGPTTTSTAGSSHGATRSPSDGSSASDTPASVRFGATPSGRGVPSCSVLLPDEQVQAVVPGARVASWTDLDHVAGLVFAAPTAGGASCLATTGTSPLDDVTAAGPDDPLYSGVTVTVLPDAVAEQHAVEAASGGPTSTLDGRCAASDAARVYCGGGVLAERAWVQVDVTRVQDSGDAAPEELTEPFLALLDHVQQTVAASGVASATADRSTGDTAGPCTADNVEAVTDRPLRWDQEGVDVIRTAPRSALDRLGGASCSFVETADQDGHFGQLQAQYDRVPGGGWVVAQRLSAGTTDRSHRLDLDGLGTGDGAWRTCDDTACSVDVVTDAGLWEHYVLYRAVAPDTSSAIERWVIASRR